MARRRAQRPRKQRDPSGPVGVAVEVDGAEVADEVEVEVGVDVVEIDAGEDGAEIIPDEVAVAEVVAGRS